jgi:undecaprenyl pyrophosphate synthase
MWPDFNGDALRAAINDYRDRQRSAIFPDGRRDWEHVG